MRMLKGTIATVVVGLVSLALLSCTAASDKASATENQVVTVQRGNLRADITGVGNLALSHKLDLPFDIPAAFDKTVALTVQEVLVQDGDSVEEGQLLAKLDISTWDDQVSVLEDKVTTAERNLTTKKRAVTSAENQVTAKKLDQVQAEINLKNAEIAQYQATVLQWPDVEKAQADLDKAKYSVEYAHQRLADAPDSDKELWSRLVVKAEADLIKAEDKLNLLLSGTADDPLIVKQLQTEQAKGRLADAKVAVETAQIAVEDARIALGDAQKAVNNARKALDEAKNASPEIKAPFTGFITKVNVVGGAEIKKGTVAVTIADPAKFEAEVMVSELDVLKLKLNGDASVQVQAMAGVTLSAKVTRISPTATIQSGVVNYKVKVEVVSLRPVTPISQTARGNLPSDNTSSGVPSGGFRRPPAGDNLTQEQINRMIQQRQQAQAVQTGGQVAQIPETSPEEVKLAEGLTVTLSITIAERNGVLLAPIQSIISRGGETIVQVSKGEVIEERPVTVGISNWQYAEITSGLSEGEQVIVPKNTTSTTLTTSQQGQRSPGGIIPGIGRMTR